MKTIIINSKNQSESNQYMESLSANFDTIVDNRNLLYADTSYTDTTNNQKNNLIQDTHILTNIYEYDDEYELRLLAPGLDKNHIEIDVNHDNVLTICAETEPEDDELNINCTQREFINKGFSQAYQLPEDILTDEISAEYNNGIISLFIPKNEYSEIITEELLEFNIEV